MTATGVALMWSALWAAAWGGNSPVWIFVAGGGAIAVNAGAVALIGDGFGYDGTYRATLLGSGVGFAAGVGTFMLLQDSQRAKNYVGIPVAVLGGPVGAVIAYHLSDRYRRDTGSTTVSLGGSGFCDPATLPAPIDRTSSAQPPTTLFRVSFAF